MKIPKHITLEKDTTGLKLVCTICKDSVTVLGTRPDELTMFDTVLNAFCQEHADCALPDLARHLAEQSVTRQAGKGSAGMKIIRCRFALAKVDRVLAEYNQLLDELVEISGEAALAEAELPRLRGLSDFACGGLA